MKRLMKKASEVDNAQKLLERIKTASDDLKDVYYVLFDNLNALFESYPDLYKQIQMVVKLPSNDDAKEVVEFHDSLNSVVEHFQDDQYAQTYIGPKDVEEERMFGEDDKNE